MIRCLVLVAHVVALAPEVVIGGVEKASTIIIDVVVGIALSLPLLPQRKKSSQNDSIGNAATNLGIMCWVAIDAILDRKTYKSMHKKIPNSLQFGIVRIGLFFIIVLFRFLIWCFLVNE
jgi:hypothetical protein